MYYITLKQSPMYRQMSLEEFIDSDYNESGLISYNYTNTRTYKTEVIKDKYITRKKIEYLINVISDFNHRYKDLYEQKKKIDNGELDKNLLYSEFKIPKRHGGLRKIDAPIKDGKLACALRDLECIFRNEFTFGVNGKRVALYHTSAAAYITGRCTKDAVARHQGNKSRWFLKMDLSNFFGSTTLEFVIQQLGMIFPFCEVVNDEIGCEEMRRALDLAFIDGVLPQGTTISPFITNLMMIPIDFELSRSLRLINDDSFVYTRYADDFQISSKYKFNQNDIRRIVETTLSQFSAPFKINNDKTTFCSSSGRNWILGLMLNKDNEITVGYKNKRVLKAMLTNYILDKKNGIEWDIGDIQTMEGKRSYYTTIEGDVIDELVRKLDTKFGVDVKMMIKKDLQAA